jgi:hypothetical protein
LAIGLLPLLLPLSLQLLRQFRGGSPRDKIGRKVLMSNTVTKTAARIVSHPPGPVAMGSRSGATVGRQFPQQSKCRRHFIFTPHHEHSHNDHEHYTYDHHPATVAADHVNNAGPHVPQADHEEEGPVIISHVFFTIIIITLQQPPQS